MLILAVNITPPLRSAFNGGGGGEEDCNIYLEEFNSTTP